jgi:hypothetical protein
MTKLFVDCLWAYIRIVGYLLDGMKSNLRLLQVIKEVCASKMPCFGLSVVIYKRVLELCVGKKWGVRKKWTSVGL